MYTIDLLLETSDYLMPKHRGTYATTFYAFCPALCCLCYEI